MKHVRMPKRASYRDGWPQFCLSTILLPYAGETAVRIVACRRVRGHEGKHRGNRAAGWWTDDEAAANEKLYQAHNRWMRGNLRFIGRPPRKQYTRTAK